MSISPDNLIFDETFQRESAIAVHARTGEIVQSVTRLTNGEVNYVFRVQTEKRVVIVRVFRQPAAQATEKLQWIAAQLSRCGIVHAKILFITPTHPVFKNGWMLQEYVEGISGWDYMQGIQKLPEFYQKLGHLLARVHAIPLERFGDVSNGKGEHENYIAANERYIHSVIEKLTSVVTLPDDSGVKMVQELHKLRAIESKLKPVLVHTDANPGNCIVTPEGELVLIDWDNARGLFWVQDLAYLTATEKYREAWGDFREDRSDSIRENFLVGHGLGEFSLEEIVLIERWFHLIQGLNWLDYLHFTQGKLTEADKVKEIFLTELYNT
jgi:Ser/Thr protein kinase RdoA (MazF antagonist)